MIKQAILDRQSGPILKPEEAAKLPPLEPVTPSNVLLKVSTLCNGKVSCEFKATSAVLESEPLAACLKNLDVGYRCFSYDRLWTVTVQQGQTVKIDCHEGKNAVPATN